MAKIRNVVANDDYTLLIGLKNNHKLIYDLKPRLQALRFAALVDMDRFKAVRVEHENTLVWDEYCQITIDEILNMMDR